MSGTRPFFFPHQGPPPPPELVRRANHGYVERREIHPIPPSDSGYLAAECAVAHPRLVVSEDGRVPVARGSPPRHTRQPPPAGLCL